MRRNKIKWCAQGDDFRTFLDQFVVNSRHFGVPEGLARVLEL